MSRSQIPIYRRNCIHDTSLLRTSPCAHAYIIDPTRLILPSRMVLLSSVPAVSFLAADLKNEACIMAAELKACDIFRTRDVQGFHFRVNHSATKNLTGGQYVEKVVRFINGFRLIARCSPHWAGMIKLSLVISCMGRNRVQQQAPKLATAQIQLRTRSGLLAHTATQQHEPASADIVGGVILYANRDEVEKQCVVDDHFTAICTVTILMDWPPLDLPPVYNLGNIIFNMPDLSDVYFQVEGQTFNAHRLVLAACSPVFRAELFGEMIEGRASCIAVEDMSPSTFRSMLYYMYHSVLPVLTATGVDDDATEMMEFQRLFVAADRYGLDKLKEMCEVLLCAGIKSSTVLLALEFAEEHTRPKLKTQCLDFLAVPENFQEVAATSEYLRLMDMFPSLLTEVRNRCKRPRLA